MIKLLAIKRPFGVRTCLDVFRLRGGNVTTDDCERDAIMINNFLRNYVPALTLQKLAEMLKKT